MKSPAARGFSDSPPPYPYGWFAVAFSSELSNGKMLTARFIDRDIVVLRTASGAISAIEAYCPHLGAHLGHGGSVVGEEIRCPFHGFQFATSGRCTFSPYGTPPPAARLGVLEAREICGVVMVWHGPSGETPWEIEAPDAGPEWRPLRTKKLTLHSHPQEVTENSVDFGHLSELHGFRNVRVVRDLAADGPRLRTSYAFTRTMPLIGGIDTEIDIRVDGLGFSLVEMTIPGGWAIRQLVLTTPVGERGVVAHIATSLRTRAKGLVGRAVWRPVETLIERAILYAVVLELRRDQPIWDNKKYLSRPALAAGDGPIGRYRRWARQFYSEEMS